MKHTVSKNLLERLFDTFMSGSTKEKNIIVDALFGGHPEFWYNPIEDVLCEPLTRSELCLAVFLKEGIE